MAIKNAKHEIILSTDMGVGYQIIGAKNSYNPLKRSFSEVVVGNTCIDKET